MCKRWIVDTTLVAVGVLGGALLLEIGLRMANVSYPQFFVRDEYRGHSLRAGARGWYRKEGEAYIRINSAGLRDREHAKAKPVHTVRIAVLGDSQTAAFQVPMEKTFWAVLERELKACEAVEGREVEVINFGIPAYGTGQQLITLRREVWDYSPDVVILAFSTGNDVSNNSPDLEPLRQPYFVYEGDRLVLDVSFLDSVNLSTQLTILRRFYSWIINHSRFLQAIKEAEKSIRGNLMHEKGKATRFSGEELGLDLLIYREPGNPFWEEAWRVTEGLIVLMRDEVIEKGATFLVVTLSGGIQVHPDPSVRRSFMQSLGVRDLFYPDRRIQALGSQKGFQVLSLAPEFQLHAEKRQVFLHGFNGSLGTGHWNTEGHRIAGTSIAQTLCNNGAASLRHHL